MNVSKNSRVCKFGWGCWNKKNKKLKLNHQSGESVAQHIIYKFSENE